MIEVKVGRAGGDRVLPLQLVPLLVGQTRRRFLFVEADAVAMTKDAEHAKTYQKTKMRQRQHGGQCSGCLMTNHPTRHLVDVYAA